MIAADIPYGNINRLKLIPLASIAIISELSASREVKKITAMISEFSASLEVKKITAMNVNSGLNRLAKYGMKFK